MFTLQEALDAVADKPEFKVNSREFGTVIDYMITTPSSFEGKTERENMILRNLRGTCFNVDGKIISLAFEKFHNLGECKGWMPEDIDFNKKKHVLEKLDGSMIRAIKTQSGYRLGTRAGITDYSDMAERFIQNSPIRAEYISFIEEMVSCNMTPIFEYTSRENQVVIDYPVSNLTVLAVRCNATGTYFSYSALLDIASRLPVVKEIMGEHSCLSDLSKFVKTWEDAEGVVVTFHSGFKVKIKADQYCLLHRSLDIIQHEKNVLELILTEKIDDLLSLVSDDRRARLEKYRDSVMSNVNLHIKQILDLYEDWLDLVSTKNDANSQAEYAQWAKTKQPYTPFLFSLRNKGATGFIKYLTGCYLEELDEPFHFFYRTIQTIWLV